MKLDFCAATRQDLDDIMGVVADAQQSLRDRGVDQWQNGYPERKVIMEDILQQVGVVVRVDGKIAAYVSIVYSGESAYDVLDGRWSCDCPYVVIHRLCVRKGYERQGIAAALMFYAEERSRDRGVFYARIDTHPDNAYMCTLLKKFEYHYCGVVHYDHGDRIAFDKKIAPAPFGTKPFSS